MNTLPRLFGSESIEFSLGTRGENHGLVTVPVEEIPERSALQSQIVIAIIDVPIPVGGIVRRVVGSLKHRYFDPVASVCLWTPTEWHGC